MNIHSSTSLLFNLDSGFWILDPGPRPGFGLWIWIWTSEVLYSQMGIVFVYIFTCT